MGHFPGNFQQGSSSSWVCNTGQVGWSRGGKRREGAMGGERRKRKS